MRYFSKNKLRKCHGFTLIEVLIALLIVAIGLAAAIETATGQSRLLIGLRDRTIAHWVAMNKANELHLFRVWPDTGRSGGKAALAGSEWAWEMSVSEPQADGLRRVEISVTPATGSSKVRAVLVDFMAPPAMDASRR